MSIADLIVMGTSAQNISQKFTSILDSKNNLLLSNKIAAVYARVFSCQVHFVTSQICYRTVIASGPKY